jgi:ketosteroid isomerase-like protein
LEERRREYPTVHAVYADGDWVIVRWDGMATARDGKPYTNSYSWFLQMRDGQIVNAVAFYDSIAFNDLWTRVKPSE